MKLPVLMFLVASTAISWGAGCEGVKGLKVPNVTVTTAEIIAAGAFTQPGRGGGKGKQNAAFSSLPEFCRVVATLTPTSDSSILIEVWMPAKWNSNLQSVGNGAWAGSISYPAMATAVGEGYAAASTDTGHTGNVADFITGHPEKVVDFAYRAVHEMTVAAKGILTSNYGRGPAKSYFNGCSTGGRQALVEVQRYPNDYDGVIAGAAANFTTHLQGAQVWTSTLVTKDPTANIPAAKYAMLHEAALAACDLKDGVKDGVIDNPQRCSFDPKTLLCKGADSPTCLTAAQVNTVRKTYQGPKDSHGKSLFPGMEPGSETGWATLSGAKPMAYADEIYKFLVFKDPSWSYLSFDPERDMAKADRELGPMMNSVDPNIKPFTDHGGKLLMYHGWADPGIAPGNSVNYYENVAKTLGKSADASVRLYMIPGMAHCGGGDGTSTFNMMGAMSEWVEKNKAPERIEASRVKAGKTDRTRPLCAYPQSANYNGSGSTDETQNFTCK